MELPSVDFEVELDSSPYCNLRFIAAVFARFAVRACVFQQTELPEVYTVVGLLLSTVASYAGHCVF